MYCSLMHQWSIPYVAEHDVGGQRQHRQQPLDEGQKPVQVAFHVGVGNLEGDRLQVVGSRVVVTQQQQVRK